MINDQGRDTTNRDSPNWYDTRQKFDHFNGMISLTIEKVQSILDFLYRYCILLRSMLQDQLFQEQEGPFVRYFLPYLHKGLPSIFSG
jgi:hypothetical protein